MNRSAKNPKKNRSKIRKKALPAKETGKELTAQFADKRDQTTAQRKLKEMAYQSDSATQFKTLQKMANSYAKEQQPLQKKESPTTSPKENKTGLPDQLKTGVENLSGHSMDDVKVHYNSDKPSQLQAHAYAQGTDIHLAPGQEKHLPHEAWHVVQQKQGRVKPTKQLKGKVQINDDENLEKEADAMGAKALQAKSASPDGPKVQNSGQTVQLVREATIRPQTDKRMSNLKKETIGVLKLLKALGEDWEKKYGKLAKEKASAKAKSIMDQEETDYPAEIRKAALRELWAQLSPEEKLEMATKAAELGGSALSAVLSNGWEALRGMSGGSGSSSSKKKSSSRGKQKEEDSSSTSLMEMPTMGSLGFLSDLTAEDLNTLYEIYKVRKKALAKIAEAKSKIEETAGEIGEFFGEQAGKIRNEADFNKRMKAQRQAFMVAKKRLAFLKESIIENEDTDRYENEIHALEYALNSLTGPGIVYRIDLNESGRIKHPDLCQEAIGFIRGSSVIVTRDNTLSDVRSSAKGFLGSLVESSSSKEQKLRSAQGQLATALETAVDKKWGEFTSWGWTPSAVKNIRKNLPRTKAASEKLEWAKRVALASASEKSDNRHPETQIFYDALAKLKIDNEVSVKTATSILRQISAKLG